MITYSTFSSRVSLLEWLNRVGKKWNLNTYIVSIVKDNGTYEVYHRDYDNE